MAEVIRMPRMSDTMEEGNIVGWLKKVGDTVEPGDVLAEVETDKAVVEIPSPKKGTILKLNHKEKEIIKRNIPEDQALEELIALIKEHDDWTDA